MHSLVGSPGELTMTLTITRKDGKVEEVNLIGKVTAEEAQALGLSEQPTEEKKEAE